MIDEDYVKQCVIPPQYQKTFPRGWFTSEHVANYKMIWQNAPLPKAWIPIEIYMLEIKRMKDEIRKALETVLDSINEKLN